MKRFSHENQGLPTLRMYKVNCKYSEMKYGENDKVSFSGTVSNDGVGEEIRELS